MKLSDVLKRKRGAKRGAVAARKSRTYAADEAPGAQAGCSVDGHDYVKNSGGGGARSRFGFSGAHGSGGNGTPAATKASNFLASLNPARWGRSHGSQHSAPGTSAGPGGSPGLLPAVPKMLSNPQLAGNREKVKAWIREQAALFLAEYFAAPSVKAEDGDGAALADGVGVLSELTRLVRALESDPPSAKGTLEQIRRIVSDSDVSSFEILHSGLVKCLLRYLTSSGKDRDDRLRTFLEVSGACCVDLCRSCDEWLLSFV